ncbi:hypothetical protein LSG31_08400 [Fodinisporobacter ferrooxydans]|uniref:Exosortase n=1 Tax=Fodinisporobacter ferrooxydans TaxID=2901836 RepID=A0ABY4CQE0_9BACL|nr:hypothetical protein LSG31_08400 [Alicyclobacillaceae bacterium MYW30-H2]
MPAIFWSVMIVCAIAVTVAGIVLLKKQKTFAGILILTFGIPILTFITVQYLAHLYPFD